MVSCHGAAPGARVEAPLRFKRPLHRCNACNPKKRDAKEELNHRSQACEVLTGTGTRVARNGRASG
jgi:hypothetical protein